MEEEAALPADRTGSGGRQVPEADPPSGRNPAAAGTGEKRPAAPGKKTGGGVDVVKLSLIGLGAVAAIAYIIVAFYFGGHFYSGATIYGIDCSRMTAGQVKEEVAKKLGEYTLTVEERNGQKDVITAEQIGLQYQDDDTIEGHLKNQRCYIWPAMMLIGSGD